MPPIALFAALLLAGCAPKAPPAAPRAPTVVVHGIEPTGLDFTGVRGDLVLELQGAPLTATLVEWDLVLADTLVLSGQAAPTPAAVPGRLSVPVEILWAEVEPALAHVGTDDTLSWMLSGTLRTIGARGDVALPLRARGVVPALVPPSVLLEGLLLRDLDLRNSLAAGDLLVRFDSPQPLELLHLEHRVSIDGLVVHEGDALPERLHDGALAFALTLDLNPLDEAVLDALATRSPLPLSFEGEATVRTPHGELPLTVEVEELVPVRDAAAGPPMEGLDAEPDAEGLDADEAVPL